jgi:hypothetical protein
MSTPVRVAGFVLALGAVFALALGVGGAVGPIDQPTDVADDGHGDVHASEASSQHEGALPGGLMVSQHGYTLAPADTSPQPGTDVRVAFTITGPDGRPVTAYDVEHDKRLHLIAVRRDFTGFQHVHPTMSEAGVWSAPLDLTAGQWRLFADFKAAGAEPLTLGTDLAVAGDYRPAPSAGESRTVDVDGYTVTLDGDLVPGEESELTFRVSAAGRPVTDLQPYLGAYGHLVVLRAGDLAYLHVHPAGEPGDGATEPGPDVPFFGTAPSSGTYRLFLDFRHGDVVHTAAFTLEAGS